MSTALASSQLGPIDGLTILSSATAFPSDIIDPKQCVLSNHDLFARLFGNDAERILLERGWNEGHPLHAHGIARREWLRNTALGATDLAIEAGRRALESSKLKPDELGLVLVATSTPAHISSSVSARVARELGVSAAAIDIRAGGVGGLAALITAATYLSSGSGPVLVVAAEAISPFINPLDSGASIYGDGAAALIFARNQKLPSSLRACMKSTAAEGKAFTIPGHLPPTADELQSGQYSFQAPDKTYQQQLVDIWDVAADSLQAACGSHPLNHFIPYAITRPQLLRITRRMNCAAPLCEQLLAEYGCTGCAAPMIALARLHQRERLDKDARLGMLSVGGGVHTAWILWEGPLSA